MKTGKYFRAVVAGIVMGVFPTIVSAEDFSLYGNKSLIAMSSADLVAIDSLLRQPKKQDDKDAKKQDEKDKDSKKRPEADRDREPKPDPKVVEVDPKRPNIREIPKARPKLRPGVVTDRVKIKRPPVRVKPGRVLRSLGI
ncbi:MAG: hypothetical protein H7Y13_11635 [Sphingobacteriaceae bacterium]|nr:hypothetical protein [Sphingobacteriaceae bacterium]